MNKKLVGASVRRGILTGTLAGFVAGWWSFAGYAKKFDATELEATEDVSEHAADLILPAVPGLPELGPLPSVAGYRVATGPNRPMPGLVVPGRGSVNQTAPQAAPAAAAPAPAAGAAPAARPAAPPAARPAAPVFAPLPALPPVAAPPAPKTKTS